MTKARENSDYTGLAADIVAGDTAARAGRKNLILNGSMQVSQRGDYTSATTIANGSYYQDRWTAVIGVTTSTQTKSTDQPNGQVGKSIRVLASSASSAHQCAIDQRVENPEWLAGRTITFSVWMRSNTNKSSLGHYNNQDSFVTPSSHSGGGAWEKLTLTHTVSATGPTDFRMRLGMSQAGNTTIASGDYFEVTEAQLELGSVATDFEHRSYGEILADCQRFYQEVYYGGTPSNAGYPNSFGPWLSLPVTMRVSPTVARSTFSGHSFYDYPGANVNSSNLVFHAVHVLGMTNTAVRAYYTGSADRLYFEGYITADAEL